MIISENGSNGKDGKNANYGKGIKRGTMCWPSKHYVLVIEALCVDHRSTMCWPTRHAVFEETVCGMIFFDDNCCMSKNSVTFAA